MPFLFPFSVALAGDFSSASVSIPYSISEFAILKLCLRVICHQFFFTTVAPTGIYPALSSLPPPCGTAEEPETMEQHWSSCLSDVRKRVDKSPGNYLCVNKLLGLLNRPAMRS